MSYYKIYFFRSDRNLSTIEEQREEFAPPPPPAPPGPPKRVIQQPPIYSRIVRKTAQVIIKIIIDLILIHKKLI